MNHSKAYLLNVDVFLFFIFISGKDFNDWVYVGVLEGLPL